MPEIRCVDLRQRNAESTDDFACRMLAAWTQPAGMKRTDSKDLYGPEGSQWFDRIKHADSYDLPKREYPRLKASYGELAAWFWGEPLLLMDLGSGSSPEKTAPFIDLALRSKITLHVAANDICKESAGAYCKALANDFRSLASLNAVIGEYEPAIDWMGHYGYIRKCFMFLGSNIGNMTDPEAVSMLTHARAMLSSRDIFLVSYDLRHGLRKSSEVIRLAYGCPLTKEFNLAILRRMETECGATLDVSKFEHAPVYDEVTCRATSALRALVDQEFTILVRGMHHPISVKKDELVHTEQSQKYVEPQMDRIVTQAGFRRHFLSTDTTYSVALFEAI